MRIVKTHTIHAYQNHPLGSGHEPELEMDRVVKVDHIDSEITPELKTNVA
jgi:hypothetical protein